jgi:tetratricopeptide (TPR) repeat protein
MGCHATKFLPRCLCILLLVLGSGCARKATEEHWLVSEVTSNIAGMLAVAHAPGQTNLALPSVEVKLSSPSGEKAAVYSVRLDGDNNQSIQADVSLEPFIWSPTSYTPFIQKIMSTWQLVAHPQVEGPDTGALLGQLSDLTAKALQAANQQISSQLATNMLDPELHEQAAFLLGCFALREAADCFSDTRQTLCRMSSHLGLAYSLRGEGKPSPDGEIANVMLLTLVGRQRDALDAIARLRKEQRDLAGFESWLNALSMRNTGDWRLLRVPSKATLVERLECYRALCSRVGTTAGVKFLEDSSMEEIPDWGRILMESHFSVEQGHQFVRPSVQAELHEFTQVYQAAHGNPPDSSQSTAILNQGPQACVHRNDHGDLEIQVIDWGTWAQFFQRHICLAVMRTEWFVRDQWGVKEETKQFQKWADRSFGGLDLYPIFIKRRNAETKETNLPEYENAITACLQLLKRSPQIVSCDNWACLRHPVLGSNAANKIPDPASWFDPPLPSGTCYDAELRFAALPSLRDSSLAALDHLRTLAPYGRWIQVLYCQRKYTKPMTPSDIRAEYGEQCDYDLGLLTTIADRLRNKPQEFQSAYEKICAIDPNQYMTLGYYLATMKMPVEAAAAYQKAVDIAPNRVWVANDCGWLVDYYYDHGQQEKALEVATMAAEVYSHQGLEIMARLLERLGRLDEAEDYFGKINERYDDSGPLFAFYIRQDNAHPGGSYSRKRLRYEHRLFPNGLQHVTLKDFSGSPSDGAQFTASNSTLDYWKLKAGDVVVAFDGYRIHNEDQYVTVRSFSDSPKMVLIVWHDGRYAEFPLELQGRRFGVNLVTYGSQVAQ